MAMGRPGAEQRLRVAVGVMVRTADRKVAVALPMESAMQPAATPRSGSIWQIVRERVSIVAAATRRVAANKRVRSGIDKAAGYLRWSRDLFQSTGTYARGQLEFVRNEPERIPPKFTDPRGSSNGSNRRSTRASISRKMSVPDPFLKMSPDFSPCGRAKRTLIAARSEPAEARSREPMVK